MPLYKLINWKTFPFKRKSFEGQLDRYVKTCVVSVDNPHKVLLVLPLYGKENGGGFGQLINIVRNHELGQGDETEFLKLSRPINGEFVEVPSKDGPLFRIFTKDEAEFGICSRDDAGKVERDRNGKVKIYHSIRVFCHCYEVSKIPNRKYVPGWYPDDLYHRFYGFNYHMLSDLTEPLQL